MIGAAEESARLWEAWSSDIKMEHTALWLLAAESERGEGGHRVLIGESRPPP